MVVSNNKLIENDWLVLHPEANHHNNPDGTCQEEPLGFGQSSDSSTSSSSLIESSANLDDLIEIDTAALAIDPPKKSDLKDDEQIDSTNPFLSAGLDDVSQSPISGSETFSLNPESRVQNTSPMHSPAVQIMERNGDYDPDRIPLSVFSRCDSLIPAEWSITSTESLFSIHAGNTSFGRDFNFSPNGELAKSGDGEISKPVEFPMFIPSPSPPAATQAEEDCVVAAKTFTEILETAEKTNKDMGKTYPVDQEKVKAPPPITETLRCSSRSRPSNGSEGSSCSFAFPVLAQAEQSTSGKSDLYQLPIEPQYSAMTPNGLPHTKRSSRFSCCYFFSCSTCCSFSFSRLYSSCRPCGFCRTCNSYRCCSPCTSCGLCYSRRSCNPCSACRSCWSCSWFSCC